MHSPVRLHIIYTGGLLLAALLLFLLPQLPLRAQVASLPAMQASHVSVSGLSSGGYMAVQFGVAYSASVEGAGIVAGGPYLCARGNVNTATTVCSCTGFGSCQVRPDGSNVAELIAATDGNARRGAVDPTANLARQRIWLFSGKSDSVVPQAVMDDLERYYTRYVSPANIFYRKDLAAQHTMPTDSFGNSCQTLGPPFISNCGYDGAGELLKWIYGSLQPRAAAPAGSLLEFGQAEFLPDPARHGMAASGFLYVPPGCAGGASAACKLHVVFHGCKQNASTVGDQFVRQAGYNRWADSNRILVLYPQATAVFPLANPNGCWDWFNYDDPRYAEKSGRQMAAVKRMVDRLTGGSTAMPQPQPQPVPDSICYTASNFDHVLAGRAYDRAFFAYARGSDQNLGLDNIFIETTLKLSGPDNYVIGNCR